MKVLIRALNCNDVAADGSRIPADVIAKYLKSDDYKNVIEKRLAFGGLTHKSRQVDGKYRSLIGPDDQVLLDNNNLFYVTKMWLEGSDFMMEVELFDESKFLGELHDNIVNLKGMLSSGCQLPTSIVITAEWSSNNVCLNIATINGIDMTANPSFKTSTTLKTYSKADSGVTTETRRIYSNYVKPEVFELSKYFSDALMNVVTNPKLQDLVHPCVYRPDLVIKAIADTPEMRQAVDADITRRIDAAMGDPATRFKNAIINKDWSEVEFIICSSLSSISGIASLHLENYSAPIVELAIKLQRAYDHHMRNDYPELLQKLMLTISMYYDKER